MSLKAGECSSKVQESAKEVKEIEEQTALQLSLKDTECSKKVKKVMKEANEAKKQMTLKARELEQIERYLTTGEDSQAFHKGSRVVLVQLSSDSGKLLNGSKGTICSDIDLESGFFTVDLDGIGEKKLKMENLVLEKDAGYSTFLKIKAKFGGMVDGMRLKLRQLTSELDHYKNQRNRDMKAKDDEIASLKKKCTTLESSVRQLRAQPPTRMSDDCIIEECVKLMVKELPQDGYASAMRTLMRCLHPDKNPAIAVATKMMQYLTRMMA
jgi:hypothetical protein